jgi:hypothetical protein
MEPFMVEDNCWTSVLLHAPDDSKEYPSLAEANDFQVLPRTHALTGSTSVGGSRRCPAPPI